MGIRILALYRRFQRIRARIFTRVIAGDFFRLGHNTVLYPPIRIAGEKQICIGNEVYLGSNSWLQVIEPDASRTTPVIRLEDGVAISGYCTITAHKSVIIESKVLIARYVYISDHTHAHQQREIPIMDQGITGVGPVLIREGAWLGQGVVVCPGVTIGKNSIIGANSVVRTDIPDYSVAAGAPAKVIRLIDRKNRP